MDELFVDRERFREEIARQIKMKIDDHRLGKERTASDFVKPKFNEVVSVAGVSDHFSEKIGRLERDTAAQDEKAEDFDREAYDNLKKELTMQKKLKEDMLTGTIPRFKPYLRL